MEKKENENRFKETRLEEGGLEEVGWKGWTCLEAKKVLGYEIGGMRVGGGRLEMVGAEKGGRIRGLEKKNKKLLQGTRLEEGGLEVVGGEGWTCLEAKKVLGYEIGGMRVGRGQLEMVGAEKGGRIRGLEKKEQEIISGNKVGGRRVGSGWGGGLNMLGG